MLLLLLLLLVLLLDCSLLRCPQPLWAAAFDLGKASPCRHCSVASRLLFIPQAGVRVLESVELDFSRYGDTLFEVLFAGGRLAGGGNVVEEGKKLDTNVRAAGRARPSECSVLLHHLCSARCSCMCCRAYAVARYLFELAKHVAVTGTASIVKLHPDRQLGNDAKRSGRLRRCWQPTTTARVSCRTLRCSRRSSGASVFTVEKCSRYDYRTVRELGPSRSLFFCIKHTPRDSALVTGRASPATSRRTLC